MKTRKRPSLILIGAAGVLAGTGFMAGCDDNTPVDVERAVYTSQADCEQDWSRTDDCSFVADGAQSASGNAPGTSSGGGHAGGGGHWYGPYYTRSGKVYHADGEETNDAIRVAHSSDVSETTMPEHALSAPHGEEGIARGGFGESAHAGGGEGGHGG
jgi:uncharacterized protein YgiB involved in biofilm formation